MKATKQKFPLCSFLLYKVISTVDFDDRIQLSWAFSTENSGGFIKRAVKAISKVIMRLQLPRLRSMIALKISCQFINQ